MRVRASDDGVFILDGNSRNTKLRNRATFGNKLKVPILQTDSAHGNGVADRGLLRS